MLATLIELVLAPALVAAATLTARRAGARAGGIVSAFPAIVGPVLLITALEHGPAFSARAANATLLGLASLSVFALAYGRAALAGGSWLASLIAGWLCAGVAALAVGALAGGAGPPAGLLVAAVSLALAHRSLRCGPELALRRGPQLALRRGPELGLRRGPQLGLRRGPELALRRGPQLGLRRGPQLALRRGPEPAPAEHDPELVEPPVDPAPPRGDLPLRMATTALLVFSLATAAALLGPLVGGMLAALPVLASLLAVFTHRQHDAGAAAALLRGTVAGMAGFVAFVQVVAWLLVPDGIAAAFLAATLVALAVQVIAMRPWSAGWTAPAPTAIPDAAALPAQTIR